MKDTRDPEVLGNTIKVLMAKNPGMSATTAADMVESGAVNYDHSLYVEAYTNGKKAA